MNDSPELELSGVGWATRGQSIVSPIDLRLKRRETLGLIGPNGSGKSTLLSLMAGLRAPTEGEVRLQGRSMARMRRREIAQRLAFVEQASDTGERITVRDAVELGRTPWVGSLRRWSCEDDLAVTNALGAVSMDHLAERDWSTLSGGERQRAHIARAHAQRPEILLLDEPTNHLDVHHQLAILDLVSSLAVTTVIALHDLQHALRCDRLLVMESGRCIALGPPAEVLTPALVRDVFRIHAELIPHPSGGLPVFSFQRLS
jgi:iron complex transport system ATP-binding protein